MYYVCLTNLWQWQSFHEILQYSSTERLFNSNLITAWHGHHWSLCSSRCCMHSGTQSCINVELVGLSSTERTASLVIIQHCGYERSVDLWVGSKVGLRVTTQRHQASPTRIHVLLDFIWSKPYAMLHISNQITNVLCFSRLYLCYNSRMTFIKLLHCCVAGNLHVWNTGIVKFYCA